MMNPTTNDVEDINNNDNDNDKHDDSMPELPAAAAKIVDASVIDMSNINVGVGCGVGGVVNGGGEGSGAGLGLDSEMLPVVDMATADDGAAAAAAAAADGEEMISDQQQQYHHHHHHQQEEQQQQNIVKHPEVVILPVGGEGDIEATPHGGEADANNNNVAVQDITNNVWDPSELDILSGRGAKVNLNPGNARFRALCFKKQPEFVAGSHPAKRRIATEIVLTVQRLYNSRFLKKANADGPWIEMTFEKAIAKACQVMRDYKRPDRVAIREAKGGGGNSSSNATGKQRKPATPMDNVPTIIELVEATFENEFGIHDNDIICGRGAYVNSHPGNLRLRQLAVDRQTSFEIGTFTEKTALATEIVGNIRSQEPPGRFLKKSDASKGKSLSKGLAGVWEELSDEKAIHKACQVMRDILRPDRVERDLKRSKKRRSVSIRDGSIPESSAAEDMHETAQRIAEVTAHEVLQDTNIPAPMIRHAEQPVIMDTSTLEIPGEQVEEVPESSITV